MAFPLPAKQRGGSDITTPAHRLALVLSSAVQKVSGILLGKTEKLRRLKGWVEVRCRERKWWGVLENRLGSVVQSRVNRRLERNWGSPVSRRWLRGAGSLSGLLVKILHRNLKLFPDVLHNLSADIIALAMTSNKVYNGAPVDDLQIHFPVF